MICNKNVCLRAIEKKDLSQLQEWRNMPKYRKFFREFKEISGDHQNDWYKKIVQNSNNHFMFSILQDDELVGCGGLVYVDWVNRNADLSLYIGKDNSYIDVTIAPIAAKLIINYAFEELNLHKLWAEIYSIDKIKQNFFSNILKFKEEGRHRQSHWTEGSWVDSIYYGLISSEYLK